MRMNNGLQRKNLTGAKLFIIILFAFGAVGGAVGVAVKTGYLIKQSQPQLATLADKKLEQNIRALRSNISTSPFQSEEKFRVASRLNPFVKEGTGAIWVFVIREKDGQILPAVAGDYQSDFRFRPDQKVKLFEVRLNAFHFLAVQPDYTY